MRAVNVKLIARVHCEGKRISLYSYIIYLCTMCGKRERNKKYPGETRLLGLRYKILFVDEEMYTFSCDFALVLYIRIKEFESR